MDKVKRALIFAPTTPRAQGKDKHESLLDQQRSGALLRGIVKFFK